MNVRKNIYQKKIIHFDTPLPTTVCKSRKLPTFFVNTNVHHKETIFTAS